MTALLIFPCLAILWLLLFDRMGWLRDQPLRTRSRPQPEAPPAPAEHACPPTAIAGPHLHSAPSKGTRR